MKIETKNYKLEWGFDLKRNSNQFFMQNKNGGKHSATYTHYHLLDSSGKLIGRRPITKDVAEFIMKYFEHRGDSESFEIYEDDLLSGVLNQRDSLAINPEDVRHKKTTSERDYTSTGDKLNYHWPIFRKLKETGYGSIIRATMTFHQVCSSRCHYCSTIARNRADSISLEEAKTFITSLYDNQAEFNKLIFPEYNGLYKQATGSDIRLRGLILSGGGQPNLWKPFEDFVNWLSLKEIDLGLITNGFPSRVSESAYEAMKWVRISITPEGASPHYVDGKFNKQYIPSILKNNKDITVGYSYVYGPWTDDDIIMRINDSLEENGFNYCRLLTDCNLSRDAQLRAHHELAERLMKLNLIAADGTPKSKIFHQLKFHGTSNEANNLWGDGQCYLQAYNVFWDTTGHEQHGKSFCYPCDSVTVLSEPLSNGDIKASERKFNSDIWGTVTNDLVESLFKEKLTPYFDPRKTCTSCLFMNNNQTVKNLVYTESLEQTSHAIYEHVNFP